NDDVNMGQSSNDVIPTAMHVAARVAMEAELIPALDRLAGALEAKAEAFDDVLKSGRTHRMDATPVRLGPEFGGSAAQLGKACAPRAPSWPSSPSAAPPSAPASTGTPASRRRPSPTSRR